MNSKPIPQWKPLEFLPVFKIMIFEMLENAKDQYSPNITQRDLTDIIVSENLTK